MKILQNSIAKDVGLLAPEWLIDFGRAYCIPTMEITRLQTNHFSSFLKDSSKKNHGEIACQLEDVVAFLAPSPVGKQVFPKSLKGSDSRNRISINHIPKKCIAKNLFLGTIHQKPYFRKLHFQKLCFKKL